MQPRLHCHRRMEGKAGWRERQENKRKSATPLSGEERVNPITTNQSEQGATLQNRRSVWERETKIEKERTREREMGTSEDEEAQQRGSTATLHCITVWKRACVGSRQRKSSKTEKKTVSRTVDQSQRTSVSLRCHCWQFAWTAFDSSSSGGKQVYDALTCNGWKSVCRRCTCGSKMMHWWSCTYSTLHDR